VVRGTHPTKGYGAARLDLTDLTTGNATYEEIQVEWCVIRTLRVTRGPWFVGCVPRTIFSFDHAAFFEQHLDACGTAGIQGSWFGWYGEDTVTIKDTEGRLIHSNACQLLRAIPNGDNMRRIPVPPFESYRALNRGVRIVTTRTVK
jgi:hypothetical protein